MKKYWKIYSGLLLMLAAVLVYMNFYLPAKTEYKTQLNNLRAETEALQALVSENARYAKVQEQLPDATSELAERRSELYSNFPAEMKEEDQIMYILYLEELFGNEIQFEFGTVEDVLHLSDGSTVQTLKLTANYECSYDKFQDIITCLATDDKITSVCSAKLEYDAEKDIARGTITVARYLINSELLEYQEPQVIAPETGKENIFKGSDN